MTVTSQVFSDESFHLTIRTLKRHNMIEIIAKKPADCSKDDLEIFKSLVEKSDQVTPTDLLNRIKNAERLVFLFSEDKNELIGIAALKYPYTHYKRRVFEKAKSPENPAEFVFEAGWIYVSENHRGQGYSRHLLEKVVECAGDKHLYATTREDNAPMRQTISRCGFVQSGHPYQSQGNYRLILYIKRFP